MTNSTHTIASLNDRFRKNPVSLGRMVVTQTVMALADSIEDDFARLISAVREFNDFSEDNDPYEEHDFGSIKMFGQTWFWKIDYYADSTYQYGSEDPSDPKQCFRVLTVLNASEY